MVDQELVKKINRGRCLALIGAGVSMPLGYPDWWTLGECVAGKLGQLSGGELAAELGDLLKRGRIPELLRIAERELGSREKLLSLVSECLLPPQGARKKTEIYDKLARWPFAFYLTTNFDDEIDKALKRQGQYFKTVRNSLDDLSLIRDGASYIIVKLHSDTSDPNGIILTSADYDRASTDPNWKYYRARIEAVFNLFDVLIVGHSMTDPDLQGILAIAKQRTSRLNPVYMFTANASQSQATEFHERFNIKLITYSNPANGRHEKLGRLITMLDKFVVSRGQTPPAGPPVDESELQAATTLFVNRSLSSLSTGPEGGEVLAPLVLQVLDQSVKPLSIEEIADAPLIHRLEFQGEHVQAVRQATKALLSSRNVDEKGSEFSINAKGRLWVANVRGERTLEEEQALGQFEESFKAYCGPCSDELAGSARELFKNAIVTAFKARGLAIARVVVQQQSLSAQDLSDVFGVISQVAESLDGFEARTAFIEASHECLVHPNPPQQKYLASVSQGYFLYHLAGRDPSYVAERKSMFRQTQWFIDSSILIPLLAIGSHNHAYAVDLFKKLKDFGSQIYTTPKLLEEAWRHLRWAIDNVGQQHLAVTKFIEIATASAGFKQNLFVDGFIRLGAEAKVQGFDDYLDRVCDGEHTIQQLTRRLREHGVEVLSLSEMNGFEDSDWGEVEGFKTELRVARETRGTFRGDLQVEAESQTLQLILGLRSGKYSCDSTSFETEKAYFVSQSRAMDMISSGKEVVTWTPEAVYRYVTSISSLSIDPDLLHQCMLHQYYYAGVSFVDSVRYTKFFGPAINQSGISYREQRGKYLKATEGQYRPDQLDEQFETVPDLEKPFFASQISWEIARAAAEKSEAAERKAVASEERAQIIVERMRSEAQAASERASTAENELEKIRREKIHAQQEANRLRNMRDPRHARKRARQAKRRKKRK